MQELEEGDDMWTSHVIVMERGAAAGVFWAIRKYRRLHVDPTVFEVYKVAYLK